MASYDGLKGILTGLTKSADHPSRDHKALSRGAWGGLRQPQVVFEVWDLSL